MPRFDGTGPESAGPMTGRGFGCCIRKSEEVLTKSGAGGDPLRNVSAQGRALGRRHGAVLGAGALCLGLARRLRSRQGRGRAGAGSDTWWEGRP